MVTDLAILRVLRERAPASVPVEQLADCWGLPPDEMSVRMRSLVSLRYAECFPGGKNEAYGLGPTAIDSADQSTDSTRVLKIAGTSPAAA